MKVDIYYYSRTGNCKEVAERLSKRVDSNLYRIVGKNKNFKGILGWIKGGYYALFNKEVEVNYYQGSSDIICLITPVWAGKIPPTIRKFINSFNFDGKQIYLLATMNGSEGNIFESIEEVLEKSNTEIIGKTAIKAKQVKSCDNALEQFCNQM
ncbi:flavodoxin family protein [Orenia marismortui]|uniref:Flavodoxin-like protein n=1 Tax=Orenia marismortui TaxID=46469 RepID=A0A4R8GYL6_9FIRM|nr:hypothetical protein [Orenia marismortui]TDX48987.1 flavodoxin-like protein [Orenia marismortui]